MKYNELKAMKHYTNEIWNILTASVNCDTSCRDCDYYNICGLNEMLRKSIQHELDRHTKEV